MRTFTIIAAFDINGCPIKINNNTTYKNKTPASAAKKAFTELCKIKNIQIKDKSYIVMREKTKDSKNKTFSYLLTRKKLHVPIIRFPGTDKEFSILYKNTIYSKSVPPITKCYKSTNRKIISKKGGSNKIFKMECVICLSKQATQIIKPCNHLCLCNECKKELVTHQMNSKCPICRRNINKIVEYTDWEKIAMGNYNMGMYNIENFL